MEKTLKCFSRSDCIYTPKWEIFSAENGFATIDVPKERNNIYEKTLNQLNVRIESRVHASSYQKVKSDQWTK